MNFKVITLDAIIVVSILANDVYGDLYIGLYTSFSASGRVTIDNV